MEFSVTQLSSVGKLFQLPGEVVAGCPYGNGHINDTFLVDVSNEDGIIQYIFQRINHVIFKDVPRLMENIQRVTEHISMKIPGMPEEQQQRVLTLIPATNEASYARDEDGNYWRIYEYLDGTQTFEIVASARHAYEAGKAFALFLDLLRDLPAPALHETIPGFHDTPKRLDALKKAVEENCNGRLEEIAEELDFVLAREELTGVLLAKLAAGELSMRNTHNDTKINNIRFDCKTDRGIAVIDLDTVMPGLVHYDFGDMIRTCAFDGVEDGGDSVPIRLRLDSLEALISGFLEGGKGFLSVAEMATLPLAGPLICLEIGIRFLTDYLHGDVYFKTERPKQNLDRARVQLQRVKLLEEASEQVLEIFRSAGCKISR